MQKRNAKQKRNIRNLAAVTTLTAIILIVSTYAWFIGLDEVTVEDFTVTIAATDSLELSLDGVNWSENLNIDPTTIEGIYPGSTNSWTGRLDTDTDGDGTNDAVGLIPMSSVGKMDANSSRLVLYEKAGLKSNPPYGTEVMASRVNNFGDDVDGNPNTEVDGYIAFDLFVKNYTGAQYIPDLNLADEESIYLIDESNVAVTLTGDVELPDGTPDAAATTDAAEDAIRQASGIENSVRVAFAQVGRVIGTETTATVIQGISCNGAAGTIVDGVTGICRDASIWEPNDTAHVAGAINYYNNNCGSFDGSNLADPDPVAGFTNKGCVSIANGDFVETYAVANPIGSDDAVNIYDLGYNGKTTIATYNDGTSDLPLLQNYDTFTDTEKLLDADERPAIMKLAPNSITKIRVYVYLEGQDIDNYDWAIEGKQITVDFGFSKQIYES